MYQLFFLFIFLFLSLFLLFLLCFFFCRCIPILYFPLVSILFFIFSFFSVLVLFTIIIVHLDSSFFLIFIFLVRAKMSTIIYVVSSCELHALRQHSFNRDKDDYCFGAVQICKAISAFSVRNDCTCPIDVRKIRVRISSQKFKLIYKNADGKYRTHVCTCNNCTIAENTTRK